MSDESKASFRTEYTSFGVVTEFLYARDISRIMRGEDEISELFDLGPERGFLRSEDALIFVQKLCHKHLFLENYYKVSLLG